VDSLAHGNPGSFRALADGVFELKIGAGTGYRVDYKERAGLLIILLAGSDKSSRTKDIERAVALARSLQERRYGQSCTDQSQQNQKPLPPMCRSNCERHKKKPLVLMRGLSRRPTMLQAAPARWETLHVRRA